MKRVVIVRGKDGREIARYTFTFSWAEASGPAPDYFKQAAQKALADGLVSAADLGTLKFEFAT